MNDWWDHVELASTTRDVNNGNIDITLPPATIDGQPLAALLDGARILLKHQKPSSTNGIYTWSNSGPTPKLVKFLGDVPTPRATVRVNRGNTQARSTYTLVDTTAHVWARQDAHVNVLDFGAVGDADYGPNGWLGKDNTIAIQDAVKFCLANPNRALFIPAGYYIITKPIVVNIGKDPNVPNSQPGYANLHIFGETEETTYIILQEDKNDGADGKDTAAFLLQGMTNSSIRRIHFLGRNAWREKSPPQVCAAMLDDNIFVVNNCRDAPISPHAAIVIDPFSPIGDQVPSVPANGYKDQDDKYMYPAPPSSGVVIEECRFENFVVGLMIAPRGQQGNADNITIRDCSFNSNKVAVAVSGFQSRNVLIYHFLVDHAQFAVDGRTYGRGVVPGGVDKPASGNPPYIFGADITNTKYLFNILNERALSVEALYCESTLSMGFIYGGAPVIFSGCTFNFCLPSQEGYKLEWVRQSPVIDCHLLSAGPIRFVGCFFGSSTGGADDFDKTGKLFGTQPLVFINNTGTLTFASCQFANNGYSVQNDDYLNDESSKAASLLIAFSEFLNVHFEDSTVLDPRRTNPFPNSSKLETVYRVDRFQGLDRNFLPPGCTIMFTGRADTEDTDCRRLYRVGAYHEFPVCVQDVNGPPCEVQVQFSKGPKGLFVSFKTKTAGILRPGNLVYQIFDGEGAPPISEYFSTSPQYGGLVGMVDHFRDDIDGQVVILAFVPQRFKAGFSNHMKLVVRSIGRFHRPSYGWTDKATASNQVHSSDISAWQVGDRIWAPGIVPGTFVIKIENPSRLTLSCARVAQLPDPLLLVNSKFPAIALTDAPIYVHEGQPFGGHNPQLYQLHILSTILV